MVAHTGTILRSSASDQHYAVLLDIVTWTSALAKTSSGKPCPLFCPRSSQPTFTRDIGTDNPPTAQSDLRGLPLARIRFLGFGNADFETDTLHFGPTDHGRTEGAALLLRFAAAIADLV
jgi:hypothetical protein